MTIEDPIIALKHWNCPHGHSFGTPSSEMKLRASKGEIKGNLRRFCRN
jgi:hypothetical protein